MLLKKTSITLNSYFHSLTIKGLINGFNTNII